MRLIDLDLIFLVASSPQVFFIRLQRGTNNPVHAACNPMRVCVILKNALLGFALTQKKFPNAANTYFGESANPER